MPRPRRDVSLSSPPFPVSRRSPSRAIREHALWVSLPRVADPPPDERELLSVRVPLEGRGERGPAPLSHTWCALSALQQEHHYAPARVRRMASALRRKGGPLPAWPHPLPSVRAGC